MMNINLAESGIIKTNNKNLYLKIITIKHIKILDIKYINKYDSAYFSTLVSRKKDAQGF